MSALTVVAPLALVALGLHGCGSSGKFDCEKAYRAPNQCYKVKPFDECCPDCGGGSGTKSCSQTTTKTLTDKTKKTIKVEFTYTPNNTFCDNACEKLGKAHAADFCDDAPILKDPDVAGCDDAVKSINTQKADFCSDDKPSLFSKLWSSFSLSSADDDLDICTQAFNAMCFNEAPFNSCCQSCESSSGFANCKWNQHRNNKDSERIDMTIDFNYSLTDPKCKDACDVVQGQNIAKDYCKGGNVVKDGKVKNCDAAKDAISKATDDSKWCDDLGTLSSPSLKSVTV